MLYRKGPGMEARLCFIGHGLMENRSGLIVGTRLTRVSGHAERLAALDLIAPHGERPQAVTLGADKGYDAKDFVMELRELNVRPHVARHSNGRRSAIDRRTTRHPGYAMSQRIRKRIEEAFGWIKTVAGLRKTRFCGLARVDLAFTFAAAAYNLVRLPRLLAGALTVTAPMDCRLVGRWRIVEADLWDRDYLVLVVPATMTIGADGHGEIAYGAMQASLELEYSRSMVFFTWAGFDEMRPGQRYRLRRTQRRWHHRGRVRLPPRRRSHPQSRMDDFFITAC